MRYIIASTMLIMTKEVGILFIAAAGFSVLFQKDHKGILAQLMPALIFVAWSYGNYTRHGWFLFPRDSPLLKLETIWNDNLVMRFTQLFVMNFNWILAFIILLSVIAWLYRHHNRSDHGRINQIMPMVLFVLFFFVSVGPIRDFNLPRYVLVLYPALYLLSAWAIYSFFGKNKKITSGIIISILALFMIQTGFSIYSQDPYVFPDPATQKIFDERQSITLGGSEMLEINLKYVDYVKADIELVRYLNTTDRSFHLLLNRFNHYSIFIAANKGIDIGYGQKYPREYKELGDFYNSPDTISYPAILVIEDFNKFDLEKLYTMYDMTLLEKIRVNGVGVDVYQIDKD
jgi:cbb3-type cytochrome oxidase subunit 3